MRKEYKNILVAVDGSEHAYNAVSEAVEITKRNKAKLQVLTVKETSRFYEAFEMSVIETDSLDKMAIDILKRVSEIVNEQVEYEEINIYDNNAKRQIVQYAKENKIDLIVIGSTGVGVIDKFLVGSTTQYVVNNAPCNVMVVK